MANKFEGLEKKRYQDIRAEIKTGDIFFASGNYPISRIIEENKDTHFVVIPRL